MVLTQVEKIIIDTDIGDDIDDALALALAAQSPELEIVGITTVFRNVQARARMVKQLMRTLGRADIPVVPGCGQPMVKAPVDTLFQSIDVNEWPGQYSSDMDAEVVDTDMHAVDYIEHTLKNASEPITLVPIGPLTNIAMLLLKNPSIKEKIKRIVVMGGAYKLNLAEYNILCDPEAARIVFDSGIEIVGVGLDVTLKCQLTEDEIRRIETGGTPASKLLHTLIQRHMSYSHHYPYLHDPLAIAVCFAEELVRIEPQRIGVETQGSFTRGMTFNITDSRWWERGQGEPNIRVCTEVDREGIVNLFLERVTT